ncbi:MAG: sigma-70 family RNA polymerase sigma factor [Aliishimia sp.]
MTLHSPFPTEPSPHSNSTLEALLPRLLRRARALSRCPALAEDLAQDCALKLWTCLKRGDQIDDLEAYAMITLRHLSASRWRRDSAMQTEELDETSATTEPNALPRLMLADVQDAITHLPEDQAALMSRVADGETSPAILAAEFGVPKGTVMSRLSRARARLRDCGPDEL